MDSKIQQILRERFSDFSRQHKLPLHVHKAASAIMACRTAALGGHVQGCPAGHVRRVWYNSCRHRFCPLCAFIQIQKWIRRRSARLIRCDYYHTVFTIAEELNPLWAHNRQPFTNLLFAAAWQSLKELLADPQHLGALPGAIASFHSWSQMLWVHPHVHFLVTGGGLDPDGGWRASPKSFLLPARALSCKFRGKLLALLRKALERGELTLPAELTRRKCRNLFNKLGRKKWHVMIMPPYRHGDGVLKYMGRYVRGGPISERRLSIPSPGIVRLRYKNPERTGHDTLRLTFDEFLARLLRHVPPEGVHTVRAYGLFAPKARPALNAARALLGQLPVKDPAPASWQELCAQAGIAHPERCPVCGQTLIRLELLPRLRAPPRRIAA
jgi:hypothetical protein